MKTLRLATLLLTALLVSAAAARAQEQAEVPYDRLKAEKNIEVGRYHMKRKNYDAAIERFRDATRYRPDYALPHFLLAEALEKKGEPVEALKHYREYLKIAPKGQFAGDSWRRIEVLSAEAAAEKKRPRP